MAKVMFLLWALASYLVACRGALTFLADVSLSGSFEAVLITGTSGYVDSLTSLSSRYGTGLAFDGNVMSYISGTAPRLSLYRYNVTGREQIHSPDLCEELSRYHVVNILAAQGMLFAHALPYAELDASLTIFAISPQTGNCSVLLTIADERRNGFLVMSKGELYVMTSDDQVTAVYGINIATGAILSHASVPFISHALGAVPLPSGMVVTGDISGTPIASSSTSASSSVSATSGYSATSNGGSSSGRAAFDSRSSGSSSTSADSELSVTFYSVNLTTGYGDTFGEQHVPTALPPSLYGPVLAYDSKNIYLPIEVTAKCTNGKNTYNIAMFSASNGHYETTLSPINQHQSGCIEGFAALYVTSS